tara:strand:+ start:709 stop:966 length:258 start_codon:yes stop_codon:yes gene_type:complete
VLIQLTKKRHLVYNHWFFTTKFKVPNIMSSKSKKEQPVCDRDQLERQIAAFLKSGGEVQQIPTGTSGQTHTRGPRQIILSHKTAN